jgi:hypothetical protein
MANAHQTGRKGRTMAEGGSRRGDRSGFPATVERPRRRRCVVKPAGWPRYMIARRLRNGQAAYYWNARKSDIERGFSLHREAMGVDYSAAIARAGHLNAHLDAWHGGQNLRGPAWRQRGHQAAPRQPFDRHSEKGLGGGAAHPSPSIRVVKPVHWAYAVPLHGHDPTRQPGRGICPQCGHP